MKKLLSVIVASLFAVPLAFGSDNSTALMLRDVNAENYKNDSLNNCMNGVKEAYDVEITGLQKEHTMVNGTVIPIPPHLIRKLSDEHKDKENQCNKVFKIKPQEELKKATCTGVLWGFLGGALVSSVGIWGTYKILTK